MATYSKLTTRADKARLDPNKNYADPETNFAIVPVLVA
jgi:hypothetical protein